MFFQLLSAKLVVAYTLNFMDSINSVTDYIQSLDSERQQIVMQLRERVAQHLPLGFEERMAYGMISYVVPLETYPKGYHASKNEPLPFISIASQKGHVAFYHMGLYASSELQEWFRQEYLRCTSAKLDMGKSCIRFKKLSQIPFSLVAELASKITVNEWIALYESSLKK